MFLGRCPHAVLDHYAWRHHCRGLIPDANRSVIYEFAMDTSRQPHHFQVAASLTLQPPARLDPVEIAVDVELEHRRRMIRGRAGRSLPNRRHQTRGRAVPAHRRTHRPREQDCSRRSNHRGIPPTESSAGDPPLERNPSSLPPPIQQGNHSIDGFSHSLGQKQT